MQVCLVRVFVGAGGVSRHTSLQGLGRGRRCDHSLGTRVVPLAAPPCPALILCVLFRLGAVMGEGLLCLQVRELCDETACERGRPASELNCIPHGQLRLLVRALLPLCSWAFTCAWRLNVGNGQRMRAGWKQLEKRMRYIQFSASARTSRGGRGWIGSRRHVLPHAAHASSLAVAAVQCASLVTDCTVLPRSQARYALYLSSAAPQSQTKSLKQ